MTDTIPCSTCGGSGKRACQLCKEVHRNTPPYIGCTGGRCPTCGGKGKFYDGPADDSRTNLVECPDCSAADMSRADGGGA
jgi:hypothetical protein